MTQRPRWGGFPPLIQCLIPVLGIVGCATGPQLTWPAAPARDLPQVDGELHGYDISGDGRLDYLQHVHGGFKDRLYFAPAAGASAWSVVNRGPDALRHPLLVLLLDGVSYDRIRNLYDRGRFRLFRQPTRVISTF